MEQTLSIIKPDAVAKNVVGKILDRFESAGLRIAATKKMQLSQADAEAFYAVHAARPDHRRTGSRTDHPGRRDARAAS